MRSINTSLIALLPVAGLLFVGAGLLGVGTIKDLALVLFVGLAAGAYSSIFLATPIVCDLKEREPKYAALRKRVAARKAAAGEGAAARPAGRARGSRAAATPAEPDPVEPVAPAEGDLGRGADEPEPEPAVAERRTAGAGAARARLAPPGRPAEAAPAAPRRRWAAVGQEAPVSPAGSPTAGAGGTGGGAGPGGRRGAGPGGGGSWPGERRGAGRRVAARIREVPDFPLPGVLFKDLTPLLADGPLFADLGRAIAAEHAGAGFDVVAGVEARGFLVAAAVALAAGTGVVPVRKAGKLPWRTVARSYTLEYGEATIEVHADAFAEHRRVLLVDDVLATGGTLAAAADLVGGAGGELVGVSVVLELAALGGRDRLGALDVHAVLTG